MKNDLNYAVELIRKADGILITAGAGMSVDSGLPDFRSVGGFWNAYPMFKEHNISFEDIATPLAYKHNQELAYWFYGHRLIQYRNTIPHEGYQILKRWAGDKSHGYFVFTSNVDGHFQKAGFDDSHVYEVHGTLERLQCVNNCRGLSWSASSFQPVVDNKNLCLTSEKPHCPYCGGFARQNVLMFNDWSYVSQYQDFKKSAVRIVVKRSAKSYRHRTGSGESYSYCALLF